MVVSLHLVVSAWSNRYSHSYTLKDTNKADNQVSSHIGILTAKVYSKLTHLFLRGGFCEVRKRFATLELGILDHACDRVSESGRFAALSDILASASLEKLPVQVTKVCPSCLPEVTGYARMVETTDE
jgi:hypothetical protein